MVASDTAELVGAAVVLALGGGAVTAAVVAWRRFRRRLRRLGSHAGVRTAVALLDALRLGRSGPSDPARLRYELWQSVTAATRAVRGAAEAGAAPTELSLLSRRLHDAAGDLDRLLPMATGLDPRAPEVVALRQQVAETLAASNAIRLAALASASDAAAVRVGALAADADREVQAVTAGIARSRAALTGD